MESTYLNRDMCKFDSPQKDESRWQSTDSSKAYRNTRAFKCSLFNAVYNQEPLATFISLPERNVEMTFSLSLTTFCRPNSLFALHSLQHYVHIPNRRDYDEQKAVVV